MNNAIAYELKKLEAKFPGYDFTATLKPNVSLSEPKQVIKNIVKELKASYTTVDISSARNISSNLLACIKIKSKPNSYDLAWYINDSIGYDCDLIVFHILDDIKSNADFKNLGLRADYFVEGNRTCSIEIYN